ncbi:histidine phosphatase family protein [Kitasatospora sp. HPMI-4]|uniref:histidine phosphatase family protein n=1 Tax=Kitasatospora sp. HPMI-4 TaxID=3448443 RepID=UPI003F1A00C7
MRILLVRHGQSQWQVERGEDWDSPLSSLGHRQARLLGEWLGRRLQGPWEAEADALHVPTLGTSPLLRARQTAGYLSEVLGLPAEVQVPLAEADFHVASELPRSPGPLQPPAGQAVSERYLLFRKQAETALRGLVRQAEQSGGPALAVTHGGLIKTLLRVVTGTDSVCFKIYNSSVTELEWRDGRWRLAHLSLQDHLPVDLRTS